MFSWGDVVFITGSTHVNGTIDYVVGHAKNIRLLFLTALALGLSPGSLF